MVAFVALNALKGTPRESWCRALLQESQQHGNPSTVSNWIAGCDGAYVLIPNQEIVIYFSQPLSTMQHRCSIKLGGRNTLGRSAVLQLLPSPQRLWNPLSSPKTTRTGGSPPLNISKFCLGKHKNKFQGWALSHSQPWAESENMYDNLDIIQKELWEWWRLWPLENKFMKGVNFGCKRTRYVEQHDSNAHMYDTDETLGLLKL